MNLFGAATHRQVQNRAFQLYNADSEDRGSDFYWHKAQDELCGKVARVIADEAGLIFKPGEFSTFPYEFWRGHDILARGFMNDDAFEVYFHVCKVSKRFNIYLESDLNDLLEYLTGDWTNLIPYETGNQNG